MVFRLVLLTRSQPCLGPLHQTSPSPGCGRPSSLIRRSPGCRWSMLPNCRQLNSGISLPWLLTERSRLPGKSVCSMGLAASCIVLKSSLLLPSQPPVVGVLGHSKLTQRLPLGQRGRSYPGKSTSVFSSALILWYRRRRGISGWSFFSDSTPPGTAPPPTASTPRSLS